MGRMFDTMVRYFIEDEWPIRQVEGKPVIQTGYSGQNGDFPCIAFVNEEMGLFSFYVKIPVTVPKDKFGPMTMFMAHLNNQATIGRFLLDLESGDIGFRQTIEADGSELTENMVRNAVMACYSLADAHCAAIDAVANKNATPEEARWIRGNFRPV
jgi:hypothetical protein